MSETEGTKVVGLDFTVKGQASEQAERMAKSFGHVHGAVEKASGKVQAFGRQVAVSTLGALGLGFGLRAVADKAKEANLGLEHITKTIAGANFAFKDYGNISPLEKMNRAMDEGAEIAEKLNSAEERLKVDRSDLARIYRSAYVVGSRHNLQQKEMIALTEKLAASEKVLGISAEASALLVAKAVTTGTVEGSNAFGMQIKSTVAGTKEAAKAFANLSESQRFERVTRAMGDLVPAAERMGQDLEGSFFSMKQVVEEVARDFTGPVFKEVTKEVRSWAHHMGQAQLSGKSISEVYGQKLVTAFQYMKGATSFIADHWKSIALIFGASKLTSVMGSLSGWGKKGVTGASSVAGATTGSMMVHAGVVHINQSAATALGASVGKTTGAAVSASLRPSMSETVGRLAGMAGKTLMVTEAFGALYVGAQGLAHLLDSYQSSQLATQRGAPRTIDALTAGAKAMSSAMNERSVRETYGHLQNAFAAYGLKPGQQLSAKTIADELRALSPDVAAKQVGMFGIKGASARAVQGAGFLDDASMRIANLLNGFAQQLLAANPEIAKSEGRLASKRDIKIEVHGGLHVTQDFKQADPDRIFHQIPNQIAEMVFAPHASNLPMVPE